MRYIRNLPEETEFRIRIDNTSFVSKEFLDDKNGFVYGSYEEFEPFGKAVGSDPNDYIHVDDVCYCNIISQTSATTFGNLYDAMNILTNVVNLHNAGDFSIKRVLGDYLCVVTEGKIWPIQHPVWPIGNSSAPYLYARMNKVPYNKNNPVFGKECVVAINGGKVSAEAYTDTRDKISNIAISDEVFEALESKKPTNFVLTFVDNIHTVLVDDIVYG